MLLQLFIQFIKFLAKLAIIGHDFDASLHAFYGFVEVTEAVERMTLIVMCFGCVLVDLDRRVAVHQRLLILLEIVQAHRCILMQLHHQEPCRLLFLILHEAHNLNTLKILIHGAPEFLLFEMIVSVGLFGGGFGH